MLIQEIEKVLDELNPDQISTRKLRKEHFPNVNARIFKKAVPLTNERSEGWALRGRSFVPRASYRKRAQR